MNNFPTAEQIARTKAQYPAGTRIVLTADLNDPQPIAAGERGTCRGVDDAGQLLMAWDAGRGLSLIPGVDSFRKLTKVEVVKEQAQAVAKTGRSNMLDAKAVFEIALEMNFDELADLIFMNTKAYSSLILTGELNDSDIIEL